MNKLQDAFANALTVDPCQHEMYTQLLEAEIEYHERRRMFFATMRKPEMRIVRAALWDMKWQHNVPWETITSLEVFSTDPWVLLTDHHEIIGLWPEEKYLSFYVWPLHDESEIAQPQPTA